MCLVQPGVFARGCTLFGCKSLPPLALPFCFPRKIPHQACPGGGWFGGTGWGLGQPLQGFAIYPSAGSSPKNCS